ncbi:MAG: ABC transporter substrate-binding protein [Chloroflexota bacterium]|nr:ABC transporter substrate-binding protein [Chloroflexota bacterium]
MSHHTIDQLVEQLKGGQISRRGFVRRATALGISASAAGMLAKGVVAQESSPAASVAVATTSITREEYEAALQEEFQFSEPENMGGEIIHSQTSDIGTLNTTLTSDVYSGWITGFLFDGLVGGSTIDGTDVPGLADYWEIGEDGVTYTFYLNQNAVFHDGTPLTAADVEFTFQSVLAEDSLSVRRSTVASTLKELIVVDDHTVQLIALAPSATFVSDAAGQFGILPKHIWESVPFAEFGADPGATGQDPTRVIGSGPFRFVEWVPGDHVTLEKNADYWDTNNVPYVDRYIYRVIVDPNANLQSLVTGESDIADVPFTQAVSLRASNPELNVVNFDTLAMNYYHVNQDETKETLFLDPLVRQALHYALDRELIAETVYQGFAIQANGTQPVLSQAYAPDRTNTVYNFDPDMARSLLEQAGWVDSDGDGIVEKDGVKFSFEFIYSEGVATYVQQIPYMQQAWREVGIEAIPSAIPFQTLLDETDNGTYQMTVQGFNWSPDGAQIAMYGCESTPPQGFNSMRYCNEEFDRLETAAITELDPEARIDLLIEASNIVNDEVATGIIVFRQSIVGSSPRLNNYIPNGYGTVWSISKTWVSADS